ncbi:unnamed protein product [Blepharisma stoltei]|uniref:Peptidase A1 domain-containing protein n=1 Tax=Blepharisma stoltei TaxID=1481888 RepID=A0AAU9KKM4_9CILI|nr:unnamed protein product [Blepharisma stoltei]
MFLVSFILLFTSGASAYIKIPLKSISHDSGHLAMENFSTNSSMLDWAPTAYLKNYINMQYYAQIYTGSPPKLFNVHISTASPWLWIPSTECQYSCHKCSNYFECNHSSTYDLLSQNYKIHYGTGFIQGDLSSESFSIGDNKALFIKNQTFILVNQDGGFNDAIYDGILGLEYNSRWLKYPTFLDNLKQQGQISKKIFSIFLSDNGFFGNFNDGSAIIFGGFDLESFSQSQEVKYVDLFQNNGRWEVSLSDLVVSNEQVTNRHFEAHFGIGVGLIYAPQNEFNSIYKGLSKAGKCGIENSFVVCECAGDYKVEDYPSISFVLGSTHRFSLESQNYFYKYGSKCYLLFGVNSVEYGWIIGDVFMRKYYTIFDADYGRIGLSLAKIKKFMKNTEFLKAGDLDDESSVQSGYGLPKILKNSYFAEANLIDAISISCSMTGIGLLLGLAYYLHNKRGDIDEGFYYKINP